MLTGRPLRLLAAAVALATSYGAGALTVALVTHSRTSSPSPSVLDEAEQRIASQAARPVTRTELDRAAVQGMLSALGDQWSAYYAPQDFARFEQVLSGAYTGIGVWVRDSAGALRITSVQPGSPAAAAGVRTGDRLLRVGGRPVSGRPVAAVVAQIRGDAGSVVELTLQRGATMRTVAVRRESVADDDVSSDTVARGVVRLRVAAFTRGVGRWVRSQVARADAAHARGIVLDLRDNPGGLLDEAVETASAFLSGGPVVSYDQRGAPRQELDALSDGDPSVPLVVLVDGGTASAAEIVAAALQDRGRAVVVGSRTFGKGSVQEPSRLSDGSALELTVGRYVTPSGRTLDGVGVAPDVSVSSDAGNARLMRRAVDVLSGLTADAGSQGRG